MANDSCDEYEISYTLTLPQDLLYVIKRYLDKHFLVKESYVEIVDTNHVRTRRQNDQFVSVSKRVLDVVRFVVLCNDTEFVPLLDRRSVETPTRKCSTHIRRLCKVLVYHDEDIEIKFEHIYYEYNDGDSLDPLMASKQITLHNVLLDEKPIDVTSNSHLGSDEILANCRLELEYDGSSPSSASLLRLAELVTRLETVAVTETVDPFIQHTSVLNEIVLRPFVDEVSVHDAHDNDYAYWAVKLDGVRGRGYIVNGERIHLQLDDMRLFAGELSKRVGHNKILCVQVEYLEELNVFYVTDVVSVYKFLYDNRNQFDKSSPYPISLQQAIQFMNAHSDEELSFTHTLRFQRFTKTRNELHDTRLPNDGFVAVTRNSGELVKIKDHRTYEMLYAGDGTFTCSFGVYECVDHQPTPLIPHEIYEVVIVADNRVRVVKIRKDRIVPN
ncbi:lef-4 [Spodoptera frugiperda granulovirus]|uniref:Lef-4 n=1 Tax=Spodoptera frugiperda granulovirus TaxID=307454 RepID=A0A0C5ASF8_9BBAC|nr:lef-4 [Spodoptera frugiperda granulovirus]AJK91752.1 lef-4 [Spodoptera frugiperda granulovirus]